MFDFNALFIYIVVDFFLYIFFAMNMINFLDKVTSLKSNRSYKKLYTLIYFVTALVIEYLKGPFAIVYIFVFLFVCLAIVFPILSLVVSIVREKMVNIKVDQNKKVPMVGKTEATVEPIFANSEDSILDMFIQNEYVNNNFDDTKTIRNVITRRFVLTILFSISSMLVISLYFFHITKYVLILPLINIILFFISIKKTDNRSYLKKQLKARPDENISDVIASKLYNSVKIYPVIYVMIIVVFSLLPLIIFSKPRLFFEKRNNGYDVRFYTTGLSAESKITIPSTYRGKPVIGIRGDVFSNLDSLEEIVLPDSIEQIRGKTFMNDANLKNINLPTSLTYLGGSAFKNCTSLESIVIPDKLEEIKGNTFEGCTSLSSVQFGKSLKSIRGYAFKDCRKLTSVNMPDTVVKLGGYAFSGCSSLNDLKLSNRLVDIGGYAFQECDNLTTVTIPDSVTRLGGYAFSDCDNLHDVKLSSNMTEIRGYTFQYCESLRNVAMPKSLTRIGGYAFYGCSSLESITIPEGTQTIGGHAFHDCSSLGNVVFPSSLKDIGSSAFRACSNLRTANVPCGISINTRAFKESPTSLQCFGGDGYTIHYYTTD